jgi:hypothetical protein
LYLHTFKVVFTYVEPEQPVEQLDQLDEKLGKHAEPPFALA